uniref:Granulins domain-containing protein n=1 Tax=Parascaris univalens TaxID=6257 RepID=A0A915ABX9_PARUN
VHLKSHSAKNTPTFKERMGTSFLAVLSAVIVALDIVETRTCPDRRSACDDGATCCSIGKGAYGCCPLPSAVCCEDNLHCCPYKTTCDVEAKRCTSSDGFHYEMRRKQQALEIVVDYVVCPDRRTKCDDGATCCELSQGRYGCCPLPRAVCCSDRLHCCPKGTKCDVQHGQCRTLDGRIMPWWRKHSAIKISHKASIRSEPASTICNDGAKCSADGQCCDGEDGSSSCCPFRDGVCCEGARFCCPRGFQCDDGQCFHEEDDMLVSKLAVETSPTSEDTDDESVTCPDGSTCPATNKCCRSTDNDGNMFYRCCPLSKGVCCNNSCCPHGYRCDERDKCALNRKLSSTIRDIFNY